MTLMIHVQMGYGAASLGFGLNFGYVTSFGTFGAELGYYYKTGDIYIEPAAGMGICFLPIVDPGQGASGNAYLGPDADYAGLVRKAIEAAKFNQSHDESWQRENRKNQIQDLEDFLANLENA